MIVYRFDTDKMQASVRNLSVSLPVNRERNLLLYPKHAHFKKAMKFWKPERVLILDLEEDKIIHDTSYGSSVMVTLENAKKVAIPVLTTQHALMRVVRHALNLTSEINSLLAKDPLNLLKVHEILKSDDVIVICPDEIVLPLYASADYLSRAEFSELYLTGVFSSRI